MFCDVALGFALNTKDTIMSVNVAERGQDFLKENNNLVPYGPLDMEPAATVINYGQSVFEGLKAMRADDGTIVMFRPDKNAERMQDGCRHYLMPEPSKEVGFFFFVFCLSLRKSHLASVRIRCFLMPSKTLFAPTPIGFHRATTVVPFTCDL